MKNTGISLNDFTKQEKLDIQHIINLSHRTKIEEAYILYLYKYRPFNWYCTFSYKHDLTVNISKNDFFTYLLRLQNAISSSGIKDFKIKYFLIGAISPYGHLHLHALLYHPFLEQLNTSIWEDKWLMLRNDYYEFNDPWKRIKFKYYATGTAKIKYIYYNDVLGYIALNIRNYAEYRNNYFDDDNFHLFFNKPSR